jgi:hypothetical protein
VGLTVNLNSNDAVTTAGAAAAAAGTTATLDSSSADNYNEATSVVAYDAQGNANTVNLYFQNIGPAATGGVDQWNVYAEPVTSAGVAVNGTPSATNPLPLLTTVAFNTNGTLETVSNNISATSTTTDAANTVQLPITWPNGANTTLGAPTTATDLNLDLTGTTLGAQSFSIGGTTNNG